MLPESTTEFTFANIETVLERRAFQEYLEYYLEDFVGANEKAPSESLLRSAGITALALGSYPERSEWYCVLRGDFTLIREALSMAVTISGANPFTDLVEVRQGVEIFGVFRDDGYHPLDELYFVMPDMGTLAMTKDLEGAREMADRWLDGAGLPDSFVRMLRDWGRADYLNIYSAGNQGGNTPSSPLDAIKLSGFHVTLGQAATTAIRSLNQFADEEQATTAADWLNEQTEPYYRKIGFYPSVRIESWQHRGATAYAEGVVPDEVVLDVIFGD